MALIPCLWIYLPQLHVCNKFSLFMFSECCVVYQGYPSYQWLGQACRVGCGLDNPVEYYHCILNIHIKIFTEVHRPLRVWIRILNVIFDVIADLCVYWINHFIFVYILFKARRDQCNLDSSFGQVYTNHRRVIYVDLVIDSWSVRPLQHSVKVGMVHVGSPDENTCKSVGAG